MILNLWHVIRQTERIAELEAERDYLDTKCAELENDSNVPEVCEWKKQDKATNGDYDIWVSPHYPYVYVTNLDNYPPSFCRDCGKRIKYVEERIAEPEEKLRDAEPKSCWMPLTPKDGE